MYQKTSFHTFLKLKKEAITIFIAGWAIHIHIVTPNIKYRKLLPADTRYVYLTEQRITPLDFPFYPYMYVSLARCDFECAHAPIVRQYSERVSPDTRGIALRDAEESDTYTRLTARWLVSLAASRSRPRELHRAGLAPR